jgi:hypothetical protein
MSFLPPFFVRKLTRISQGEGNDNLHVLQIYIFTRILTLIIYEKKIWETTPRKGKKVILPTLKDTHTSLGPSRTTFLEELTWALLTSANAFLLTILLAKRANLKRLNIALKA